LDLEENAENNGPENVGNQDENLKNDSRKKRGVGQFTVMTAHLNQQRCKLL